MAKLYFRYGAVGSAKTLNLLAVAHSYGQQGKKVLLLKPELDSRFGSTTIKSRAGLSQEADFLLGPDSQLDLAILSKADCVLVDEAQFLSANVVDQLRVLADQGGVPVICYGLRTDFRTRLFPGSLRLMELADEITEVKTTCAYCTRKAVFNLKHLDGKPTLQGPVFDLGAEEKYLPACSRCYNAKLSGVTT